jgi:hypothetical protein
MTPQQAVITAVIERFGPKTAITDPGDIAPWLIDWRGRWHGASAAILSPASTGEVAAIVALAVEHRVALVPQGGNSGMVGGATPPADGSALLISLRRMNRIRSLSANLAVAEAGVILETLHNAAAEAGSRFPLTLGARGTATIGGLVSTNAGGTQVLRFGTMRSLVAGLEDPRRPVRAQEGQSRPQPRPAVHRRRRNARHCHRRRAAPRPRDQRPLRRLARRRQPRGRARYLAYPRTGHRPHRGLRDHPP